MKSYGRASTGKPMATKQQQIRRLAWLLDDAIPLPGGFRIGLDGIVGLIPGIGDVLGLAASTYIVSQARSFGVPRSVLARMIGNVGLESVIGVIPILGDLFDIAFKANRRNLALMERYLENERQVQRSSRIGVVLATILGLALLALLLFVAVRFVQWLWALVAT